jgi:hypothetical protein
MSLGLATIYDGARLTSGTGFASLPILVGRLGSGSERFAAARKAIIDIRRDRDGASGALDGTLSVRGAMLPHRDGPIESNVQRFKGSDGTSGRTVFDINAAITYTAQLVHQWIVIVDGVVQAIGAVTFSNPSGTLARATFGTAVAAGSTVEFYKVTPVVVIADLANAFVRQQIDSYSALWIVGTHAGGNFSKTLVTLDGAAD